LPKTIGSPAAILQTILEEKWALEPQDKDMVIMQHQFEIETPQGMVKLTSNLVCIGHDQEHTAMAKTVGLPLALAVDLFLDGKIKARGLQIPVSAEIYGPILLKLKEEGITFEEIQAYKS
jgi:saccharopine dehydrogenase (NADP+, L-glutamate forming)